MICHQLHCLSGVLTKEVTVWVLILKAKWIAMPVQWVLFCADSCGSQEIALTWRYHCSHWSPTALSLHQESAYIKCLHKEKLLYKALMRGVIACTHCIVCVPAHFHRGSYNSLCLCSQSANRQPCHVFYIADMAPPHWQTYSCYVAACHKSKVFCSSSLADYRILSCISHSEWLKPPWM